MKKINIAKDYSETPLGRYRDDGEFSGERFRDEILVPALTENEKLVVEIDGVEGYGSSFLEEAFGGLVRKGHFTADQLRKRLQIAYEDKDFELYGNLVWRYIDEAKRQAGAR